MRANPHLLFIKHSESNSISFNQYFFQNYLCCRVLQQAVAGFYEKTQQRLDQNLGRYMYNKTAWECLYINEKIMFSVSILTLRLHLSH